MEQENNKKQIGLSGLIIAIIITVILTTAINIGVYYLVLAPKSNTPNPTQNNNLTPQSTNMVPGGNTIKTKTRTFENEETNIENITYDIIVVDWADKSGNMVGGFSTPYGATLVNSSKKELYEIDYSDVWEVHEQNGSKDSVRIDVHKISDNKLASIKIKSSIQNLQSFDTIKSYLDNHVKVDYDLSVNYQCIDDIQYDIVVKDVESTVKEDEGRKTPDGIYANLHYYELINTSIKKEMRIYCYDLAQEYNQTDEDDNVIIEISTIEDGEIEDILSSASKNDTLQDLSDLLDGKITEEYLINIREY